MPCTDEEALQMGLIENLQRDDLGPMEEAESLKKLIETYGKTQEQVAQALGKSRSYVANILRLNQLPESVKTMLRQGELSAGHARALINAHNVEEMAQKIASEKLSVREAENLARSTKPTQNGVGQSYQSSANYGEAPSAWKQDDPILADAQMIASKIGKSLGVHAKLVIKNNTGILSLHFHHLEQLDDLVNILARSGFD
jgi:ParB family chromosome partitioning protein